MISKKFRAWDAENKQWIYSHTSHWGREVSYLDSFFKEVETKKWKVCQWTGRIDRKGKLVYEDDIVGVQSSMTDDVICLVEWDENRSGFYMPDAGWLYFPPGMEMEVVGDIYQNPNMIKKHA